jgi:hypothetical protein
VAIDLPARARVHGLWRQAAIRRSHVDDSAYGAKCRSRIHPAIGAGNVFLIFAVMMVLQLLWVKFFVPETKGKSLEELEKEMVR